MAASWCDPHSPSFQRNYPAFLLGSFQELSQETPQGGAVPTVALSWPWSLSFAAGEVPLQELSGFGDISFQQVLRQNEEPACTYGREQLADS